MLLENIGFKNINPLLERNKEDQWPFWNIHTSIRNRTPYRLYVNGSLEGWSLYQPPFSFQLFGSQIIIRIIMRIKFYVNSLQ